jgi:hypothetical protein
MADSGAGLTIPVRAEIAAAEHPAATARVFVDRENANTLSQGTPAEVYAIAQYLASQHDDLTARLMPLLTQAIGGDREHWASVAAGLVAADGTPRPKVADLLSGTLDLKQWSARDGVLLRQAALQKLKAPANDDREPAESLLIKSWVAAAPLNPWGAANSLLEFGSHPVTTEALRQALRDDVPGTSYIAWTLARNDHRATLPDAIARALKVVDRPGAGLTDLQGAAALLRDFGNDEQLRQLATIVRKYQTRDEKFYASLWQYASESENPRDARVLAVVLRDRRVASGELRYCDFAVGALQLAVGQNFHAGESLSERDAAVSRALAWLATQGISE